MCTDKIDKNVTQTRGSRGREQSQRRAKDVRLKYIISSCAVYSSGRVFMVMELSDNYSRKDRVVGRCRRVTREEREENWRSYIYNIYIYSIYICMYRRGR